MDDLGILLSDVNPGLEEIKNLFSLYAAATGAEMNFFKCHLLSYPNRPSPLPSPWNHIPSSEDTLYLGVPISLEGEIGDFWKRPMAKARAVAHRINNKHLKISARMYLINTHIMSLSSNTSCASFFSPRVFSLN